MPATNPNRKARPGAARVAASNNAGASQAAGRKVTGGNVQAHTNPAPAASAQSRHLFPPSFTPRSVPKAKPNSSAAYSRAFCLRHFIFAVTSRHPTK